LTRSIRLIDQGLGRTLARLSPDVGVLQRPGYGVDITLGVITAHLGARGLEFKALLP